METVMKEFQGGKLVIGTNRTLKMARAGKIRTVYLTNSAPQDIKARLEGTDVRRVRASATELGKFLGKNFPIAVCGVKK
ncbi:MAG: ribosomal L7Ae/L30e/S12e/Gadd45 family protein [Candidatus Aenigmatarchaeota archaeon]